MTEVTRTALLITGTAAAVTATAGIGALSAVIAQRVIHPQRAKPTRILHVEGDQVTLSGTALTRAAGVLGLLYDEERQLAVLAPELHLDDTATTVERHLEEQPPRPITPGLGRAVGNIFSTPEDLGLPVHEVSLPTSVGPAPAWIIGETSGNTWLVHIHGSLSGREGALRSAAATRATGYPSIVPSFRGDGEGPPAPRNAFMLGQTEWRDIEPALDYAKSHGAGRIVLIGWSNGASMALRLATSSAHRDLIAGVIGISPVLDWASTIRLAVRGARLPGLIAALALRALQAPGTSALLGAPEPLAFSDLAWTTTAVPTLLLHSAGDRTASYADSVAFHDRNSGLVTLPELAPSPHALEWNADPERFARLVCDWIDQLAARASTAPRNQQEPL